MSDGTSDSIFVFLFARILRRYRVVAILWQYDRSHSQCTVFQFPTTHRPPDVAPKMRRPILVCLFVLPVMTTAAVNRTKVEARLPKCSVSLNFSVGTSLISDDSKVNCFNTALFVNPDLLDAPERSCPNVTLQKPLSACLQRACAFEEQKQFSIVTNDICKGQPVPSRGLGALIEAITLGPVTLACVAARFYSKRRLSSPLGFDDYFILAATALYSGTIPLYIVSRCCSLAPCPEC